MNNKTFDTALAMSDMDDALVSEAVRAGGKKRRRIAWIAAAAAALVLIAGTAVVLPKLLKSGAEDVSAFVPTEAPVTEAPTAEPMPAEDDHYNGGSGELVTEAPAPTEYAPVPTREPVAADTMRFDSVGTLNMAVACGTFTDPDDPMFDLKEIYMPTKVPYGAELKDVVVKAEAVTLTYEINEEWSHGWDEGEYFILIWRRDWQQGSAESFANMLYSYKGDYDSQVHCVEGVWIFNGHGNIERYAVWEHEGRGFEMITPGYYCDDEDTLGFVGLTRVALGDIDAHIPDNGFTVEGWMWLSDGGMGFAPLTATAENNEFLDLITDDMRTYEGMSKAFPHVGMNFEPVLLEDTEIVRIDVYHMITLEPIALDISLDELYDIARLNVSEELSYLITGSSRGCVLVDIVIAHGSGDDVRTYHCGFLIECGC